MKRKSRSAKERLRLFTLHGGVCHICGGKIQTGDRWELSHVIEWELTRDDSDENVKPAHYRCHRDYTYTEGNPMVAKTLRLERKNLGIKKQSSRPIPGSKRSGWKSTFNNGWVRREGS